MPPVQIVGNAGRTRVFYDTENIQTRNGTGVFGCLDLSSVEGGGNRDDRVTDLLPEVGFDVFLHLEQDHGRDLLSGKQLRLTLERDLDVGPGIPVHDSEGPALYFRLHLGVVEAATDKTFNAKDGVCGIYVDLVLGIVTNETPVLVEGNTRGAGAAALGAGNDFFTGL
ncbi:NAD-specific glutamate dehydrogenase-domain-containing protein [Jimgerdemannia flammicorona]|uniref:NAD-specific glutamate dehydrogenase-domain-containing protein n=1 Tax=Jimgerdemannia flammicorona TaxID=994334 RepID=A0A433D1X1_9FUNG|nr:NAD-specific glutamate dehydrogenase-domain-containing protein [Jimgerdemannia flammicorona]